MVYSLVGVAIRPIINSSPLILLTRTGLLDLLQSGTLGLVLTAKLQGIIPAARPVLEQLCSSGMYLSEQVMNQALALVGE